MACADLEGAEPRDVRNPGSGWSAQAVRASVWRSQEGRCLLGERARELECFFFFLYKSASMIYLKTSHSEQNRSEALLGRSITCGRLVWVDSCGARGVGGFTGIGTQDACPQHDRS